MTIEVTDYINVVDKAKELGLNIPTGLAILPSNFKSANSKDELIDEEHITTIRSLWRQNGLSETRLEDEDFPVEMRRSLDVALPTIFVGISLLTQEPNLVTIAINVISNYLTDFFKGLPGTHNVKLDTIVQKTENEFRSVHYEGNVEGLDKIPAIIEALMNNQGESSTNTQMPPLVEATTKDKRKAKSIGGTRNVKRKARTISGKRKKHT